MRKTINFFALLITLALFNYKILAVSIANPENTLGCSKDAQEIATIAKNMDIKSELELLRILDNLQNIKRLEALAEKYLSSGNNVQDLKNNILEEFIDAKSGANASWYRKLQTAIDYNAIDWIKLALKNADGKNVLEGYLFSDDRKILKLLLAAGADPNVTNPEGLTPLHRAVNDLDLKAVRMLLYRKANPNAKIKPGGLSWGNKSKLTPLLLILGKLKGLLDNQVEVSDMILDNYTKIIEALLINGAEVKAKNAEGQSSLSIAKDILRIITFNNFQLQQQYKNCPIALIVNNKKQKAVENIISLLVKYGARERKPAIL